MAQRLLGQRGAGGRRTDLERGLGQRERDLDSGDDLVEAGAADRVGAGRLGAAELRPGRCRWWPGWWPSSRPCPPRLAVRVDDLDLQPPERACRGRPAGRRRSGAAGSGRRARRRRSTSSRSRLRRPASASATRRQRSRPRAPRAGRDAEREHPSTVVRGTQPARPPLGGCCRRPALTTAEDPRRCARRGSSLCGLVAASGATSPPTASPSPGRRPAGRPARSGRTCPAAPTRRRSGCRRTARPAPS